MPTFMFRPVTRNRGGDFWSTTNIVSANASVNITATSAVVTGALGTLAPMFNLLSTVRNLKGLTMRLQMTSAGVVGNLAVYTLPSFQVIVSEFAVADTQALDITMTVPTDQDTWLIGTGPSAGITAGTLNVSSLTFVDNAISQDTQLRPKVIGGDAVGNRRGTVFANRIR